MDCVGLVLCVGHDLGLVDVHGVPFLRTDYLNYGPQPVDRFVHDECARRLSVSPAIRGGCVLTLRNPSVPCHMAIVSNLCGGLGIIHAHVSIGRLVEHILDAKWLRRIEGIFQFPGITA
jgi:hypothetical protein